MLKSCVEKTDEIEIGRGFFRKENDFSGKSKSNKISIEEKHRMF